MNNKHKVFFAVSVSALLIGMAVLLPSCKSCNKPQEVIPPASDTITAPTTNMNTGTLTTPHGDSSLIPVFTDILEQAFAASKAKDYENLGSLMVYRGNDKKRHGLDVFRTKNAFDKSVVKVTAEVFSKWSNGAESVEYTRVFALPQPDGRSLQVMEVIFIHPKKMDRKFFGFLEIDGSYKIADVTSYL